MYPFIPLYSHCSLSFDVTENGAAGNVERPEPEESDKEVFRRPAADIDWGFWIFIGI